MQMLGEWSAQSQRMSATNLEGAIDLRHAFLKPQRPEGVVVPEQQVRVFMKDRLQRYRLDQREHDQVFVAAVMEESGEIGRFAIAKGTERADRARIGKGENNNGHRSDGLCAGEQRVGLAELFEAGGEF